MANSGFTEVKVTAFDTLRFSWSLTSQSVNDNTSVVNWALELDSGEYGAIESGVNKNWWVTVNGKYYSGATSIEIGNNDIKTLASGSTVIAHNTDGTKTFTYSFYQAFYITFNGKSITEFKGTGSGTLDKIARKSSFSCSNGIVGQDVIITINKKDSSFKHNLLYNFADTGNTFIVEKTDRSSWYWTIPEEFYNYMPSISRECKIICTTYSADDVFIGSAETMITISVDEEKCKPIFNFGYKDNDSNTVALTGDYHKFIKYASDIKYAIDAGAQNGATIASYSVKCGSKKSAKIDDVLVDIDGDSIEVIVTDSRGLSTIETIDLADNMINYIPITCSADVAAPTTSGTVVIDITGKFYNGSFSSDNINTIELYYRYKIEDGNYTSDILLNDTLVIFNDDNTYSLAVSIDGFEYTKKYTFIVGARDRINSAETWEKVVKTQPIFDWSATDFNFNVPVYINGTQVVAPSEYIMFNGSVEMGSNGTWYWSLWSSGKAECYGCRNFGNMAVNTDWGGLFRSAFLTQSLPDIFTDTPDVIDISFRNSTSGAWIAKHESTAPSKTNTGAFIVLRPAAATLSQAYISFHVIGRWF